MPRFLVESTNAEVLRHLGFINEKWAQEAPFPFTPPKLNCYIPETVDEISSLSDLELFFLRERGTREVLRAGQVPS